MPLGVSDSLVLVWVCACVRASSMQRVRGVGRTVILSQWRWTHCVSSCRLLLMLLSYNSLPCPQCCILATLLSPLAPYTCAQACGSMFAIVPMQLCLSICVCLRAYVVRVLPSCSHSTSWSSCGALLHFCIIRSLPKVEREAGPHRQWIGTRE